MHMIPSLQVIGKTTLMILKRLYHLLELQLAAYAKNVCSTCFYKLKQFEIITQQIDSATQEIEYRMRRRKN